ncbi:hypothetical protein ACOSQ4_013274 [Xanthoceras sorbifolium]
MSGGVYRIKEHIGQISGNVAPCPKATPDAQAKCRNAVMETKGKKRGKKKEELLRDPHTLGPMDRFVSTINPEASLGSGTKRQQNINEALLKKRTHNMHQYVSRWVYGAEIPFNAIDNDDFKLMMKAVGQFGPGYKPPSQYELREPLLKEKVQRTKELLKKQEEDWALNGCSIMTDVWFDRKGRSIMNLCVNCSEATTSLSSKSLQMRHTQLSSFFSMWMGALNKLDRRMSFKWSQIMPQTTWQRRNCSR